MNSSWQCESYYCRKLSQWIYCDLDIWRGCLYAHVLSWFWWPVTRWFSICKSPLGTWCCIGWVRLISKLSSCRLGYHFCAICIFWTITTGFCHSDKEFIDWYIHIAEFTTYSRYNPHNKCPTTSDNSFIADWFYPNNIHSKTRV